jgi:hypothetical protein
MIGNAGSAMHHELNTLLVGRPLKSQPGVLHASVAMDRNGGSKTSPVSAHLIRQPNGHATSGVNNAGKRRGVPLYSNRVKRRLCWGQKPEQPARNSALNWCADKGSLPDCSGAQRHNPI